MFSTPKEILRFPRTGWVVVLGYQWRSMTHRKSHKCCTVSGRVPKVSDWLCWEKGCELKNWILEQPINNKGC